MAKDILDLMNDLVRIASSIKNMDLNTKIMEMQSEMFTLLDENREIRLENEKIKNERMADSNLERSGDFLKMKNSDSDDVYCMFCWDNERKLLRAISADFSEEIQIRKCLNCDFSSTNFK